MTTDAGSGAETIFNEQWPYVSRNQCMHQGWVKLLLKVMYLSTSTSNFQVFMINLVI